MSIFIRSIIISAVILTLIALAACTTSSDVSRGSLSDAMEKSRDDYPEERDVPTTPKEESPGSGTGGSAEGSTESGSEDEKESETAGGGTSGAEGPSGPVYLGGRGGNAWHSEPYFDSLYDAEILLGYGEEHVAVMLYGGLKAVKAKKNSELRESIEEGVLFLRAGVEARYYPMYWWQVFSPYVLAQLGGVYMYWSFQNPLDAGSETITSDSVGGLAAAVGAGVDLIHLEGFHLGVACIPEAYLFTSETQKGFENDVFDSYGTVRWTVEMGWLME
jgi:hypothetical protein